MTLMLPLLLAVYTAVQPPASTILRTGAYGHEPAPTAQPARAPPFDIVLGLAGATTVTTERLHRPERLAVDIHTPQRLGKQFFVVGHHGVRTARTSDDGEDTRIVLDLAEWRTYTVRRDSTSVRISFASTNSDRPHALLAIRGTPSRGAGLIAAAAPTSSPQPRAALAATPTRPSGVMHAVVTSTPARASATEALPSVQSSPTTALRIDGRQAPTQPATRDSAKKAATAPSKATPVIPVPAPVNRTSHTTFKTLPAKSRDVPPAPPALKPNAAPAAPLPVATPTTTLTAPPAVAGRTTAAGYRSIDSATQAPTTATARQGAAALQAAPLATPVAGRPSAPTPPPATPASGLSLPGRIVQRARNAKNISNAANAVAFSDDVETASPSSARGASNLISHPAAARTLESSESRIKPRSLVSTSLQAGANDTISVEFNDADIRYVLGRFADFAQQSIIAGHNVTGKITAKLTRVPWRSGLEELLRANGLALEEGANGILRVDNLKSIQARQSYEVPVTRILRVNYVPARDLAPSVAAVLSRDCVNFKESLANGGAAAPTAPVASQGNAGNVATAGNLPTGCVVRGSVAFDTTTNRLIITEVPRQIEKLQGYIKQLDIKVPRVRITAKIIEVNRTGLKSMGVTYDLGTRDQFSTRLVSRPDPTSFQSFDSNGDGINDAFRATKDLPANTQVIKLNGSAISGIGNANIRVANPALQLVASTLLGGSNLTAFLDAVQSRQMGELTAEPSVITLSNRSARLLSGEEIPVRVIDAASGGGNGSSGAAAKATVTFREVGIILDVTPSVTESGQIMMRVSAERSSASIANTDVGVTFQKSSGRSTILVGDKERIPIGGLLITEKTSSKDGIPYLSNLPFIGRLFSTTTENVVNRDLMIIITPEIVRDGTVFPTTIKPRSPK